LGAGVLCVHLHRRPGIARGGGFYLQASGESVGAIAVVVVGWVGKERLLFALERTDLRDRFAR